MAGASPAQINRQWTLQERLVSGTLIQGAKSTLTRLSTYRRHAYQHRGILPVVPRTFGPLTVSSS